jgi:hypothetical protein
MSTRNGTRRPGGITTTMENAVEIPAELLGDIRALLQELVDVDTYDQVGSITEPMPSAPSRETMVLASSGTAGGYRRPAVLVITRDGIENERYRDQTVRERRRADWGLMLAERPGSVLMSAPVPPAVTH